MLVRSFIGVIAAALIAGSACAAPARLVAFKTCPVTERGCVELRAHWDFARTDMPPFDADGLLAVRGALGKGDVEAYRLSLPLTAVGGRDFGVVAYLGRSKEGRPIVLTDRGPLAIDTRGMQVGRGSAVVILDTRKKVVVQSYIGGLESGAFVISSAKKVAVQTRSGACLAAPSTRPGVLKASKVCAGAQVVAGFSEPLAGTVEAAPEADLALVRRLLPQTADHDDATLRAKIGRIDKDHLVVTPW